jgi:Protein of unknown function (DUF3293)
MKDEKTEGLFQAYEETKIEIFQSEKQIVDLGWIEYFVITAWNPFSKQLSLGENRRRNSELEKDLSAVRAELLKAIGHSNDWKWFEESFAVRNIKVHEIVQIARKYQQNAIFQITTEGRKVISCIN